MTAEELRLGNYVMYNGIVVCVYGIIPPAPRKEEYWNGKWILELFDGASTITARLEDISPIKLDKDWFDKFSFQFFEDGFGWDKYRKNGLEIVIAPTNVGKIPAYYVFNDYIYIRLVHKLQNLYYVLKEKDLTL